jgi:hypothetical protein
VIELEDRSVHGVAVLALPVAERQRLLEGEPHHLLPERQHRLEGVRE